MIASLIPGGWTRCEARAPVAIGLRANIETDQYADLSPELGKAIADETADTPEMAVA